MFFVLTTRTPEGVVKVSLMRSVFSLRLTAFLYRRFVRAPGVSLTTVPCVYECEQVAPQSIPAGELDTLPLPVPALLTVSVWLGKSKVAVTERAWSIVTVQA